MQCGAWQSETGGIQGKAGVQTGVQLRQLLLFLISVAREVAFNWNPVYPLEVTFEHQHSYSISSECRSAAHTWNFGYLVSLVLTKMAVCRFAYWVPPSRMERNPWRFDTPATGGSAALTPGEEPNVGVTQIMGRSCSPLARG